MRGCETRPSDFRSLVRHSRRAQSALHLFAPLTEAGNATAQYWVADLYQHGLGVEREPQRAVDLLTQSAQQGFVPAQERLGEVYLNGRLVLQDMQLARQWLSKAATAGNDIAQYELSRIYERGWGVPVDTVEAYAWAAVATSHGNALGQQERDRIMPGRSPADVAKGEARAKEILAQLTAASGAGMKTGFAPSAQPNDGAGQKSASESSKP